MAQATDDSVAAKPRHSATKMITAPQLSTKVKDPQLKRSSAKSIANQ